MTDAERAPTERAGHAGADDPASPPDTGEPSAAAQPGAADVAGATDEAADRRAFMRQLSRDAVSTAGRLAGFSSVLRRSVVAASASVAQDLAAVTGDPEGEEAVTPPADPAAPSPAPSTVPATAVPAGPVPVAATPARDPVASLTPDQHAFLATRPTAILAINDVAGPPHVTASRFHWDGSSFHLPAGMFTARATNVERDTRVSLLIEDDDGAWVSVTGVATVVHGEEMEQAMLTLLARYVPAEEAAARWAKMRTEGDRIVIRVVPTRFLWRPAEGR